MKNTLLIALLLSVGVSCVQRSGHHASDAPASLTRLGSHSFKITTEHPEAQRAFDRGLTWAYGFGHYAAEQEFRRAAQVDPDCAMAYWGIALVNGPHINFPLVPPERAAKAWEALTRAQDLAPRSRPQEQALIRALAERYANPQPEDRSPLDLAYAEAMRGLWRQFPADPDIGVLCAEALMDLHPWDLWTTNGPQPWTPEIVSTLERVLKLDPRHPGANHLYIHAIEASPNPDKALAAANRLLNLVPDSSHLVHMPSHIYARVGDWRRAAESNRKAMQADARYREAYPRPGFYGLYMIHNTHFLAFTSMMQGRREEALTLARQMIEQIPDTFLEEYGPVADGFMVFVPEVMMRFGLWEQILAEPVPRGGLPFSTAYWHFTRAVAFTALDRLSEAREEKSAFERACAKVPNDSFFGNNSAADLLAIAERVLAGEMLAQEGRLDAAVPALQAAVDLEDRLRYDEPPDWIQPVRHTLGAVMVRAGRFAEAEQVYRKDLSKWPHNGWSLLGLQESLKGLGKTDEAKTIAGRLRRSWTGADITPSASCYCQAAR